MAVFYLQPFDLHFNLICPWKKVLSIHLPSGSLTLKKQLCIDIVDCWCYGGFNISDENLPAHLESHVSRVPLQLFPQLLAAQLLHVQDGVLPLDLLHAVGVVGHVLPDPDLAQPVPVAPVGRLEVQHQVHQRPQFQGLEHEVLPPADAQRAKAPAAVDPEHDVVEVVP